MASGSMSLPPRPHELVPRRGFESSFEGVYQQLTWADEFDDCPNGEPDPRIFNSSAVTDWAKRTAACIVAQGFDGIGLDAEGSYTVHSSPAVSALR